MANSEVVVSSAGNFFLLGHSIPLSEVDHPSVSCLESLLISKDLFCCHKLARLHVLDNFQINGADL